MKYYLFLLIIISLQTFSQTQKIKIKKETNQNIEAGKKLYRKNCSPCHSETDQQITGPSLIGVTKRLDIKWLTAWVKSQENLIKSGDKYANEVFKRYGYAGQPNYDFLTDQEIKDIFAFTETFVPLAKQNK